MCHKNVPNKSILIDGRWISVDRCLANIIVYLQFVPNLKTLACCCGHGKYPPTIIVSDHGRIIDLFSGKIIPRKKRFYKSDEEGFYYLPENSSFHSSSISSS